MKKALAVVASLLLAVCTFGGEFPDISISDLKSAIQSKKVVVIDVNGTESWQKGHVPGALDYDAIQEKLASVLPEDKNALVVAYCGGPKCMAYKAAAEAANKLGYKNVKHMSAGIAGWKEAKQRTEKGK
jgi:rhodanese-related sulfurtransferase